ncbi:hypothetical protein [Brevifollis gellanilyticus]|uniref:Uncharacterized protein n=1 Tax=Brevifollis gellanilyticus TaxID=748831 RepID=A0A512MA60_9BACT|nr:hypothetical protein [Brevifollis gellanilyticus]GEP43625.1 hypothetical protein BGE01nite_29160 [Brevifollis gellanilyticus]
MSLSDDQARAIAEFPAVLQQLIHAELAAGNSIDHLGGGFPAPPAGAMLKFTKKVTTRARVSDDEIDFRERNSSIQSGEFTDAKRFYFVVEPPDDPAAYPNMDAIRAEMEARQRAADAELQARQEEAVQRAREAARYFSEQLEDPRPEIKPRSASPLVTQFLESMEMNYERWHDGIGYDLNVFESAKPKERKQIEDLLINRPLGDWRDVEALAALDSPRARKHLRGAFESANLDQKIDLISHATSLFTNKQRTEVLMTALQEADQSPSMTQVMLEIQEFHPPKIIKALLEGVKTREDVIAGAFAMMLLFLHGKADSPYDNNWRPFMLRFQGEAREPLVQELRRHLGVRA